MYRESYSNEEPLGSVPDESAKQSVEVSTLNRADLEELEANLERLPVEHYYKVRDVLKKVREFPSTFDRKERHFPTLLMMHALSNSGSERVCKCRPRPKGSEADRWRVNPLRPCNEHDFCPACSYRRGITLCNSFLRSYERVPKWSHVTISMKTPPFAEIDLSESDEPRPPERAEFFWKAIRSALRGLFKEGLLEGAIVRDELAVLQFVPLKYSPHTHALVAGADFKSEDFVAHFREAAVAEGLSPESPLEVDIREVEDQRDFLGLLKYFSKPIPVHDAYTRAWNAAGFDRDNMFALHNQVELFLDHHEQATAGHRSLAYIGRCWPTAKHSLKTPGALHWKHESEVRETIESLQSQPIDFDKIDREMEEL